MKESKINLSLLSVTLLTTTVLIGGLAIALISNVSAATDEGTTFVEKLATKLGVSTDKVETALDEIKTERETERLDQAVSDGDITEDQKSLILDKLDEIETRREEIDNQSLTAEERRNAIDELRDEVQSWASENDIPTYLMMGFKGHGMGGRGGEFRMM